MPDEVLEEKQPTEEVSRETPPPEEKPPETPPEEPPLAADEDKEPGGASPQEIRARKEYRARKKVEAELEQEKLTRIRLEERARVLEEQAKQKPAEQTQKIYTKAELRQLVASNQIDQDTADKYEDEVLIPHRIKQQIDQDRQQEQAKKPIIEATQRLGEYLNEFPGLKDQSDSDYNKIKHNYDMLIGMGYDGNDHRTHLLAIYNVKGDLDEIRKKKQTNAMSRDLRPAHAESSAGGGNGSFAPKTDLSKAPPELVSMWERTGTPQAAREKELRYWQENQKRPTGR